MNCEVCFDGILSHDANARLCEKLAECLEARHSGLIFTRCDETGAALALLLAEGVVIHWQGVGPVGREQARAWADSVRASFSAAAAAPPELH